MLFDFAAIPEPERYRLLVATVVPRPIAWVVTQDAQGRLNAAPYSFFNVVSPDPPLIILGIGPRRPGEAKDTARNIRDTGEFVVNLVAYDNLPQMTVTAIEFPPGVDEIAAAELTTLPSARVRPPRIAESPVALECRRHTLIDLNAERILVLGEVLAMHIRDGCVSGAGRLAIDTPALDLVGRMHGSGWYVRTTDLEDVPRLRVQDWQSRS